MRIFVKNMINDASKIAVISNLGNLGLHCGKIELGDVEILENISSEQFDQLRISLLKSGFDLLYDHKAILVEKIKIIIIEMIHHSDDPPKVKFSNYLSQKLNYDYTYLANIFSEVTGTTIEHFVIHQKIEKVKELLSFNDLNLTQISFKLNYSSVAHLSTQFKKVTGLTPSIFRQLQYTNAS